MNVERGTLERAHVTLTAEVGKLARMHGGRTIRQPDSGIYRSYQHAEPSPAERQMLGRLVKGLAHQARSKGYRVEAEAPRHSKAMGCTDHLNKVVTIDPTLQDERFVTTLIHELAHIRCSHYERRMMGGTEIETAETEAESVSYIVAKALGIDSLGFAAPYLANYTEGDMRYLADTKARVLRVSEQILADL